MLHCGTPLVNGNGSEILVLTRTTLVLRKWFEPRSNIPWLKKIIWVIAGLTRTDVSDWGFNKLCGSPLQSQVTLKMASAEVVETSVTKNSPSPLSNHPDDLLQSRYLSSVRQITTKPIYGRCWSTYILKFVEPALMTNIVSLCSCLAGPWL